VPHFNVEEVVAPMRDAAVLTHDLQRLSAEVAIQVEPACVMCGQGEAWGSGQASGQNPTSPSP